MENPPVIICTAHGGVFFGYKVEEESDATVIVLKRARMIVFWPEETHGVLGLAAMGALDGARISPAVETLRLRNITAEMRCSNSEEEEIAATFEAEPWT